MCVQASAKVAACKAVMGNVEFEALNKGHQARVYSNTAEVFTS